MGLSNGIDGRTSHVCFKLCRHYCNENIYLYTFVRVPVIYPPTRTAICTPYPNL